MPSRVEVVHVSGGRVGHQFDAQGRYLGSRVLCDADFMGSGLSVNVPSDLTAAEQKAALEKLAAEYWQESRQVNADFWSRQQKEKRFDIDYPVAVPLPQAQKRQASNGSGVFFGLYAFAIVLFIALAVSIILEFAP